MSPTPTEGGIHGIRPFCQKVHSFEGQPASPGTTSLAYRAGAIRNAVARFVVQLVIGVLLALVVAALWALAKGGAFVSAFHVGLYVFGGIALLLGALGVGGMSPSQGVIETYGRIPRMKAYSYVPPDGTAVNSTAIFLLTGVVLVGLAIAV